MGVTGLRYRRKWNHMARNSKDSSIRTDISCWKAQQHKELLIFQDQAAKVCLGEYLCDTVHH